MNKPPLLSAETRVRIRQHLGYINVQEAYTFVLGVPSPVRAQFTIEGAMEKLIEAAYPRMMKTLDILDELECSMGTDLDLLDVSSIGNVNVSQSKLDDLKKRYRYFQGSLANFFGVAPYPYDQRNIGGSINVPVIR